MQIGLIQNSESLQSNILKIIKVTELNFIAYLWYYISDGNILTTGHTSAGLKRAPRNVCRDLFHPSSKVIFLKLTLEKTFSE